MSGSAGILGLATGVVALGLAGYVALDRPRRSAAPDARVDVLEGQVARLTKLVSNSRPARPS